MKRVDIRPNAPKIEIMSISRLAFTDGYGSGTIKSQMPCMNGCDRIEFFPDDIEQGENIPRPTMKTFIVKREFKKPFAEGEFNSARRQKILITPRSRIDLPEKIRNTEYGKWLTVEGQKAWLESTYGKTISSGDEAIGELIIENARGQITKSTFEQMKQENTELRKMNKSAEGIEELKSKKENLID